MKSRSPLIMLEQLLMLLVFALAAALCLQAFVLADSQSKTTSRRDSAIIEVQRTAETIKYCGGDMEKAAGILGADWEEDALSLDCGDCSIYARNEDSGTKLLGSARVWAEDEKGQELLAISVAWQSGGAQ